MRATKGYVAGVGTTSALVGAIGCAFAVLSAVVAVHGWPLRLRAPGVVDGRRLGAPRRKRRCRRLDDLPWCRWCDDVAARRHRGVLELGGRDGGRAAPCRSRAHSGRRRAIVSASLRRLRPARVHRPRALRRLPRPAPWVRRARPPRRPRARARAADPPRRRLRRRAAARRRSAAPSRRSRAAPARPSRRRASSSAPRCRARRASSAAPSARSARLSARS